LPDAWELALEGVLARFASQLEAMAGRMRLDASERDAVVQDLRIRLWKAAPAPENLRATSTSYLYRAARWAALDLLRDRRRRPLASEAVPLEVARVPARERVEDDLDRGRLGAALEAAVEALAPDRRTVVSLWLSGYHRAEIETLTGGSEARVRNLLYRGLEDLRKGLQDIGLDAPDRGMLTEMEG